MSRIGNSAFVPAMTFLCDVLKFGHMSPTNLPPQDPLVMVLITAIENKLGQCLSGRCLVYHVKRA